MMVSMPITIEVPNPSFLLAPLTLLHLRFRLRAIDPIRFGAQPGSALRGALYGVLSDSFCSEAQGFGGPDHAQHCPVCWLLALEHNAGARGKDVPRPLMIEPPLDNGETRPGEEFSFGVSLVGRAQTFLPFIVRAVEKMGKIGVGYQRGRFTLCEMREYDPLLDVERSLLDGRTLRQPKLVINSQLIDAAAENFPEDKLALHFLTPTRLTDSGHLVKTPDPVVLTKRLIERCQSLVEYYGESQAELRNEWRAAYMWLTGQAQQLTIAENTTRWVEVHSGSRRQGRYTPISGFVGSVCWQGNVRHLLPWLLWGQSVHVGKDAVKGNGWYRVAGG